MQNAPYPGLPADLQDAVNAARSRFLNAAETIRQQRLALAIKAFRQNSFAPTHQVLVPLLDGWKELVIPLAKDYFLHKMRAIAEKQYSSGAIAWANSQTRSALDQAFGTTWFSAPEPKPDAASRKVASWLREIDEGSFVPPKSISGSLPALADDRSWRAIFLQQVHWRGHGWLVTWLKCPPAAFKRYVDNPLEPLADGVQTGVISDITLYLFDAIDRALEDAVKLAVVKQALVKSDSLQLLQFTYRGKKLVAESGGNTETKVSNSYEVLVSFMKQAQSIVRSSGSSTTVSELKTHFKNTYFATAVDMDDWSLFIEEFRKPRSAGCRNLTIGLLARRTGKSLATIDKYTKPSRKGKRAAQK